MGSQSRRMILGTAMGLALLAGSHTAMASSAASYPDGKPIKMLVGFAAGGANDILARLIAKELGESLGTSVVVENRPGAGGLLAADLLAKAQPDGLTLMLGSTGTQTVLPALTPRMSFDPRKSLAPVSLVADSGNAVLVNSKLPVKNVQELIALAKEKQGQLNYGSSGNGSTLHLAGALFAQKAGLDIVHVPYKGNSQAINDVSAGQIQMVFSGIPPALTSEKTGQTRILAVTTQERMKSLPHVPTVAEAGLPGYALSTWYGVLATGGTDPQILDRLATEVHKAIDKPQVQLAMRTQGVEPVKNTPAEFSAQIDRELNQWARDIKALGIKAD